MRFGTSPGRLLAMLFPLLLCGPGTAGTETAASQPLRRHVPDLSRHHAPSTSAPHQQAAGTKCEYGGAQYAWGAPVPTAAPCLRCRCARGALVCYLRVCPPLPDPPPPRCLLHLKRGDCCSQLKCEEGVFPYQHGGGLARMEEEDTDLSFLVPFGNGCVHRGTLYAAGSAMSSSSACEHCFCIGGRMRCVRPSCLPPPPGCTPRLAALPACCPQRYDCTRPSLTTHAPAHVHTGCLVEGRWFPEGERVPGLGASVCDNCFCMRGLVRCMAMACAPALLGCRPIIRHGECCAHRYDCGSSVLDNNHESSNYLTVTDNFLTSVRNEDRSLHSDLLDKTEPTTNINKKSTTTSKPYNKHTPMYTTVLKEQTTTKKSKKSSKITTTERNKATITDTAPTNEIPATHVDSINSYNISGHAHIKTTEANDETTTTQPDESVRIVINGTINCTAEYSTSALPINNTQQEISQTDTEARTPNIDRKDEIGIEDYAFNPNDLITERTVDMSKDDNDTTGVLRVPHEDDIFMVNVSTFVRTNSTQVTLPPVAKIPADIETLLNISIKKKDDYDYDYGDATLPPSLPNLKIIPFVAADAVLENTEPVKSKPTYPLLEREDKFPVYFPSIDHKLSNYSTIKEDSYSSTQFPVYSAHKFDTSQLSGLQQDIQLNGAIFSAFNNEVNIATHQTPLLDDYNVVTSHSRFDSTEFPAIDSTENKNFGTHSSNLFSPPVETEGGFLPKDPPIMDDYYALHASYPSTPDIPVIGGTHQATSINFDKHRECVTADGRRVPPGGAVSAQEGGAGACSRCVCTWGVVLCSEPACPPPPPGCRRAPQRAGLCCGLLCDILTLNSTKHPNVTSPQMDLKSDKTTTIKYKVKEDHISNVILAEPSPDLVGSISTHIIQTAKDNALDNSMDYKNKSYPSTVQKIPVQNTTESPSSTITSSAYVLTSEEQHIKLTTDEHTTNIAQGYVEEEQKEEEEEEDDEEEDGGFSFGSVLKMLLSDNYDSTTTAPNPHRTSNTPYKYTTVIATKLPNIIFSSTPSTFQIFDTASSTGHPEITQSMTSTIISTSTSTTTTSTPQPSPSRLPFVPLAVRPALDKGLIKKVDHLMLGEVNSIHRRTERPVSSLRPTAGTTTTTVRPAGLGGGGEAGPRVEENLVITNNIQSSPFQEKGNQPSASSSGFGGGLLKLAGCNIYGRMYRVGRIISELSSACLQCMCTELGVQCRPLGC